MEIQIGENQPLVWGPTGPLSPFDSKIRPRAQGGLAGLRRWNHQEGVAWSLLPTHPLTWGGGVGGSLSLAFEAAAKQATWEWVGPRHPRSSVLLSSPTAAGAWGQRQG